MWNWVLCCIKKVLKVLFNIRLSSIDQTKHADDDYDALSLQWWDRRGDCDSFSVSVAWTEDSFPIFCSARVRNQTPVCCKHTQIHLLIKTLAWTLWLVLLSQKLSVRWLCTGRVTLINLVPACFKTFTYYSLKKYANMQKKKSLLSVRAK